MLRHEFLVQLHKVTAPRNYLEIGVSNGRSLALSQVPSIAIDPAFKVTVPLRADIHLVKATSDSYFAGKDPLGHLKSARNPLKNLRRGRPLFARYLGGTTLDLSFIDGMHLFEYALRDFINIEKYAAWSSVIVFDDMLPRSIDEAARDRHTDAWTGDVYKIVPVLQQYRPDLTVVPVDTRPTGVALVFGADPANAVLRDRYQEIVEKWVIPDPQKVPGSILDRLHAVKPEVLLGSSLWPELVTARNRRARRSRAYNRVRSRLAAITD